MVDWRSARTVCIGALGVALATAPAEAAEPVRLDGTYLGLRAIGAYAALHDLGLSGGGAAVESRADTDTIGGIGLVVGKYWHPSGLKLRTEVEYLYRLRFDADTRTLASPVFGYETNLSTHSAMINLFYDFRTGVGMTPYVGMGAGYARHLASTERTRIDAAGNPQTARETTTDSLAWSAMVGATVDIDVHWGIDFGYRFADLGEVKDGPHASGETITADSFRSHELAITLHYRF